MIKPVWEEYSAALWRIKVEGGYLYAESDLKNMCFVPDVDLTRYQSHLRDAYKQGYKDGHQDARSGVQRVDIE